MEEDAISMDWNTHYVRKYELAPECLTGSVNLQSKS